MRDHIERFEQLENIVPRELAQPDRREKLARDGGHAGDGHGYLRSATPWKTDTGYFSRALPASILNRQMKDPEPYSLDGNYQWPTTWSGFLMRPEGLKVFCSYPADGLSMKKMQSDHLPGCGRPKWCTAQETYEEKYNHGKYWNEQWCAWSADDTKGMLLHHLAMGRGFPDSYNELIVDASSYEPPAGVWAFFYTTRASDQQRSFVRGAHSNFLREAGKTAAQVPLLRYDAAAKDAAEGPFKDVSTGVRRDAKGQPLACENCVV